MSLYTCGQRGSEERRSLRTRPSHSKSRSSRSLAELIAYPRVTTIEQSQSGQLVDELGREFRKKRLFLTGRKTSTNQLFEVRGKVIANPKSQVSTLLWNLLGRDSDGAAQRPIWVGKTFATFSVLRLSSFAIGCG